MIEPYLHRLNKQKIILACNSPRRIELLQKTGIRFDSFPNQLTKKLKPDSFKSIADFAMAVAEGKALSVLEACKTVGEIPPNLVIGVETVACKERKIYGKPSSKEEACFILRNLSGCTHSVITGVCLMFPAARNSEWLYDVKSFYEETFVTMSELSAKIITAYVSTGQPMDELGAYGMQDKGATIIKRIDGDFSNAVGFPVHRFCYELCELIECKKTFR
ncbi:probable bifunctional dTTP/UTP pyrophosphatase/methyltransferase protein [Uloborus diversus]|uniref:probable bifunctional dTTP/UTP pyrophosphatase/methyltransferase protein n=1 Tax=Uloborus diversus TaxID=327109 RepID=UPI002409A5C9|nr:probable bifunctional dTTP/UTP pyrophosphatase/methyltransferase protein [Uloborus diversus]